MPTLRAVDWKAAPIVAMELHEELTLLVNDQGGGVINIEKGNVSPTIRSQMGGHPPVLLLDVDDGVGR